MEELLRAYAPVTMARLVKHDMDWNGCPMKADDWVLLPFPAGNRDPEAFEDADKVIIDREENRHAAFGLGIHRCAGSHLASHGAARRARGVARRVPVVLAGRPRRSVVVRRPSAWPPKAAIAHRLTPPTGVAHGACDNMGPMTSVASPFSPFVGPIEPITETDDEIRRMLEEAEIPPLLPALAYVTGDLSLLRDDLRPNALMLALPQGGLDDTQLAAARELALQALIRFRDNGSLPAAPPSDADVLKIMEFAVGADDDMAAYLPLLEEELAILGEDRRAPDWHADGDDFRVAIIGAGMSGLLVAHRLQQAGIPFVILEKNADVGGTWYENSYPGCRVDNPNHNYSYSFAQRHDWPLHFSTQDVLLDYLRRCADAFGLREHIRFETEVVSATWSESDLAWTVRVRGADGAEESLAANAVVSFVGQLNRPSLSRHRRRRDLRGAELPLRPLAPRRRSDRQARGGDRHGGQRLPVRPRDRAQGRPSGGLPAHPALAPARGPTYHHDVPEGKKWLLEHVPFYGKWYRFWLFWMLTDGFYEGVRGDPDWAGGPQAVSEANAMLREMLAEAIRVQAPDEPDLLAKVIPTYPVGGKRALVDNGVWVEALKRDNVDLISQPIDAITPKGVVTRDGAEHRADVIIYGTGFHASRFLWPMRIVGRGGVDLHEAWNGDARAYLGMTAPGFPNLFILYGPNTNIVVNGSIIFFSECSVRYVLGCLKLMAETGSHTLEVKREVHDAFNVKVDAANALMAWGAPGHQLVQERHRPGVAELALPLLSTGSARSPEARRVRTDRLTDHPVLASLASHMRSGRSQNAGRGQRPLVEKCW